jgi:hypothetical protein
VFQAEHARVGGFLLLEDPLVCHGELCVAEGLLKSHGDALTAVGGFMPPKAFELKQPQTVSGIYQVVAVGGYFGKDKRWTVSPPDASKFTVEECKVRNMPCLFISAASPSAASAAIKPQVRPSVHLLAWFCACDLVYLLL